MLSRLCCMSQCYQVGSNSLRHPLRLRHMPCMSEDLLLLHATAINEHVSFLVQSSVLQAASTAAGLADFLRNIFMLQLLTDTWLAELVLTLNTFSVCALCFSDTTVPRSPADVMLKSSSHMLYSLLVCRGDCLLRLAPWTNRLLSAWLACSASWTRGLCPV